MVRRMIVGLVAFALGAGLAASPAAGTDIVGGRRATRAYGFMVSLQAAGGSNHFCGGSLVRARWVLTAAHCATRHQPTDLRVLMGSHKLSDFRDVYPVEDAVIHPRYYEGGPTRGPAYDVALLRLKQEPRYPPIALAMPKEKALWNPGTVATVIGWGTERFNGDGPSEHLKELEVPVVSDESCGQRYEFLGFDPDSMVCAGEETGGEGPCSGDSGGPLMVLDHKGELLQVGVVSWGVGCAFPASPGVFVEVGGPGIYRWLRAKLPPPQPGKS